MRTHLQHWEALLREVEDREERGDGGKPGQEIAGEDENHKKRVFLFLPE